MNTSVMNNAQPNVKCVVFTPSFVPRRVANIVDGTTQQCVVKGDIILSKSNQKDSYITLSLFNETEWQCDTKEDVDNIISNCLTNDIEAFLNDSNMLLPAGCGWNGEDTINDVVFELGLDKFLTGFNDHNILGGVMNITSNLDEPSVGSFDVNLLLSDCKVSIDNAADDKHVKRLFDKVDINYVDWLMGGGVNVPRSQYNWRLAKQLPATLSVACIMQNGEPVRFNDLVVWREGEEEPEVISVFDLVKTFKMKGTNFLSLPYEIDETVTRVMYILHHRNLTDDGDNAIWLYRNR